MSNVLHVKNSTELADALNSALGGETIELASGYYGDVSFSGLQFDSTVTITSSDASDMANIRSLNLSDSSNIHIDKIFFDYTPDENTLNFSSAVKVDRSQDIVISNSKVEGGPSIIGVPQDAEPGEQGAEGILGLPNGRGITVTSSSDIRLEKNEVSVFHRGIILSNSDHVDVVDNEVHHTRASTLAGGDLNNILVEGNYFHSANPWNFGGAGDHGDYVFFWTGRDQTEPSENIIIKNNFVEQGDGEPLLGIILGDRSYADAGFINSEISGNVVKNGHHISISVDIADGVIVRENTLIQSSGDAKDAPQILIGTGVQNSIVENNISYGIINRSSSLDNVQFQENLFIQGTDPTAANYYGELFVTSAASVFDIQAIPGDMADGIGSSLTQFNWNPDTLTPQFQVNSDEESAQALVFDASLTVGPLGPVSESDAEFQWDFGDGTTAVGRIVKHDFASVGRHDVTLTVITKDGTTAKAGFTAGIVGDDIVQFDAQAGLFEALAYGEETALDGSELSLQNTADGYALKLGGEGTQASVAAGELTRFLGTDSFEMTMTLKADSAESWGEVARIHTSFTASVDEGGNLQLDLFPDDGSLVRMASEGIALNDGGAHDVTIRFDGNASFAEILIDGVVVASEPVSGSLGGDPRSLDFGNPWGHQNFDGELSAFSLSADSRDYTVYDGEAPLDSGIETPSLDESSSTPVTEEPVITKDTTTAPESEETVVTKDTLKDDNVQNEFAETGTLTLNHIAQTVTLQRSYENPVVVAFVATENGGQPVNVRVSDISDNKLKLQLQEPNYLDGWHVNETVNYMVVEAGTWTLPDGTVFEAGTLNSDKLSTQGFETVGFNAEFDNAPVILSQVQSFNGGDFVATRQQGAGVDGFKLTMQEEEALNRGGHVTETLGWVAIEPGSGTAGDVSWQAGSISDITDVNASVGLGSSIAGGAKVIAGLSSYAGGDTAWARGNGSTATGFDVSVEEETSKDAETKHIRETVDYFVFNKAGTISGTPIMEEEAGLTEPLLQNGYQLDIASIETSETVKLHDDARITEAGSLSFDGEEDYISIGRLTEFEASHKIAFSVDFTSETSSGAERLIWNHSKVGLTLEDDGLRIHAQNNDGKFHEGFQIEGLGLNDGKQHNATVMVDAGADRLQVVVNNELVLDETGTDFDFVGGGGNEWGWSLGTAWNSWFEGEVHDFQVSDEFSFVEVSVNDETVLL